MPNPFRKKPSATHTQGDWLAEEVGLCSKVHRAWAQREPGGIALVGHIGSGKTAALDLWEQYASEDDSNIVITLNLGQISPDDALHNFHAMALFLVPKIKETDETKRREVSDDILDTPFGFGKGSYGFRVDYYPELVKDDYKKDAERHQGVTLVVAFRKNG